MWRLPISVCATLLALSMAGAFSAQSTVSAAEEPPATGDRFQVAQWAAEAAVEFDYWMITEQELVEAETPLAYNLVTQQVGVGSAQAARDEAREVVDQAQADRVEAQQQVDDFEALLQTFAISTFLLSDPELDPNPRAQANAARRQAPIETITADVLAGYRQAEDNLGLANRNERGARHELLQAAAYLELRVNGLDRATELIDVFEQLKIEREEALELRTEEAFDLNDEPRLTSVRGIRVNVAVAANVEALLAAAEEDGILLSGWGHRPVEEQLELRLLHCGDSGYALFDMVAGECSPPTARPGFSQHEVGAAIDFTENGVILSTFSPGFVWLSERAAEFGFFNLPSEPWHWSTTGG